MIEQVGESSGTVRETKVPRTARNDKQVKRMTNDKGMTSLEAKNSKLEVKGKKQRFL